MVKDYNSSYNVIINLYINANWYNIMELDYSKMYLKVIYLNYSILHRIDVFYGYRNF